jgi:hypothetical protein
MAYTKNLTFVTTAMQKKGWKHFRVDGADGKTIYVQDDPEARLEDNVLLLEDVINQHTGLLHIKIYERSGRAKTNSGSTKNYLNFTIDTKEAAPAAMAGIQGPAQPSVDYEALLREQEQRLRAEFKKDMEILDLKRQIKEAQEGSSLDKYLPMIAGLFQNGNIPVGVAGQPDDEPELNTPKQRLNSAVQRLLAVDSDLIEHLEQLADLAESKPDIYKMAISQLNNFQ